MLITSINVSDWLREYSSFSAGVAYAIAPPPRQKAKNIKVENRGINLELLRIWPRKFGLLITCYIWANISQATVVKEY